VRECSGEGVGGRMGGARRVEWSSGKSGVGGSPCRVSEWGSEWGTLMT
jgi:hypothetical protein